MDTEETTNERAYNGAHRRHARQSEIFKTQPRQNHILHFQRRNYRAYLPEPTTMRTYHHLSSLLPSLPQKLTRSNAVEAKKKEG